eukprot:CAMPEP_0172691216 /NCGR_PEP_ID=MMETSP1074-20121228/24397_1 /TAXON_ID=2916 /ORGANISM="Ceratium fusus, Strain PA161109" /LENGTH=150 /DNA_ID=CAMNT_0013511247 /DNA_START=82 /DNA_END=534 /DNA_ORIENTATION=-
MAKATLRSLLFLAAGLIASLHCAAFVSGVNAARPKPIVVAQAEAAESGKAKSPTARIQEIYDKLDGKVEKSAIQKVLNAFFESAAKELNGDEDSQTNLHGYVKVKKWTKPATKGGEKMKVAGNEIVTKAKPAETKISASVLKKMKDVAGI